MTNLTWMTIPARDLRARDRISTSRGWKPIAWVEVTDDHVSARTRLSKTRHLCTDFTPDQAVRAGRPSR